jgi:hypothetical protein
MRQRAQNAFLSHAESTFPLLYNPSAQSIRLSPLLSTRFTLDPSSQVRHPKRIHTT